MMYWKIFLEHFTELNLLNFAGGGFRFESIFYTAPAASKNDAQYNRCQKRLRNNHIGLRVWIRDTFFRIFTFEQFEQREKPEAGCITFSTDSDNSSSRRFRSRNFCPTGLVSIISSVPFLLASSTTFLIQSVELNVFCRSLICRWINACKDTCHFFLTLDIKGRKAKF